MDFESRRQRILDKMEDNSIAILYSGIEHHVSADEYDLFTAQANRNFFYLTGLRRDNMVLVLDKCVEPAKTMLFIEEADPTMERWYGRKVTMEEAEEISGIDIAFTDNTLLFLFCIEAEKNFNTTPNSQRLIDNLAIDNPFM